MPYRHRSVLLALISAMVAQGGDVARAQTCPTCVPISDLGAGLYLGQYEGGLYPGGVNTPPSAHGALADAAALSIVPRLADGRASLGGRIGLLTIGMSNTNEESGAFERGADAAGEHSSRVTIVNGGVGGRAVEDLNNPATDYWSIVSSRLASIGLTDAQVQAVWLKEAFGVAPTLTFPDHAIALRDQLAVLVRSLKVRYPNLALVYLSSRSYGGYNTNPNRAEPLSYETGFAVKWLIEQQIGGDAGLNADAARGAVVAPVLLWGPYLWANGAAPRGDGLLYLREDYEADGVHPSPSGEVKIAGLLRTHFQGDAHAAAWYRSSPNQGLISVDASGDATIDPAQPNAALGLLSELRYGPSGLASLVRFTLPADGRTLRSAKLSFVPAGTIGPGQVQLTQANWTEPSVTYNSAPMTDPAVIGTLPTHAFASLGVDTTSALIPRVGETVGLRIASAPGNTSVRRIASREAGSPPRLILAFECLGDVDASGSVGAQDLFDYLGAFFAGSWRADVNASGGVTTQDLFDFLGLWFGGC